MTSNPTVADTGPVRLIAPPPYVPPAAPPAPDHITAPPPVPVPVATAPGPRTRRRQESGRGTKENPPGKKISYRVAASIAVVATFSVLAVWLLVFAYALSGVQEQRAQSQLYDTFRGYLDASSPVAPPLGGSLEPGTPVAVLNSAKAGLSNVVVVEGTAPGDLLAGPGHQRNTPLPGQAGVAVVAGRSVTGGAPFADLTKLAAGDVVTVTTAQGTFAYKVDGTRRPGDPLPTALAAGGSRVVFATSEGSGWRASLAPGQVVYVDATLQGQSVVAPAGRPVSVPTAETPMKGDPSAWLFVVLWVQGLLVAGIAFSWAWVRWGRWQTWLVGTPVILALLWGASQTAMRLIPNLI